MCLDSFHRCVVNIMQMKLGHFISFHFYCFHHAMLLKLLFFFSQFFITRSKHNLFRRLYFNLGCQSRWIAKVFKLSENFLTSDGLMTGNLCSRNEIRPNLREKISIWGLILKFAPCEPLYLLKPAMNLLGFMWITRDNKLKFAAHRYFVCLHDYICKAK